MKLKAFIVCDYDGEIVDHSDDKDEAVMLSVLYDGTWETKEEYAERMAEINV